MELINSITVMELINSITVMELINSITVMELALYYSVNFIVVIELSL